MDEVPALDRAFAAQTLHNAAVLAREMHATDLIAELRDRIASFPWNDATRLSQFHSLSYLGWSAADNGDHLSAFGFLRRAADAAPTTAWQLTAVLDLASLMFEIDDRTSCSERVAYADSLAESIDWKSVRGEQVFSLLHLAELHAADDMNAAVRYWERFRDARAAVSAQIQSDPRMTIISNFRQGVFEKMTGQFTEAYTHLRAALDQAESLGLVWRAALATRHLAEISDDERVRAAVARYAAEYPHSILGRRTVAVSV